MNTRFRSRIALFLALGLSACASAQRPVTLLIAGGRADCTSDVVRALADNGQEAEVVDPLAGIVHTAWQDTGFGYGSINRAPATIVRRYTVVMRRTVEGDVITLRVDAKRCVPGTSMCESMNGIVSDHQGDLDSLGEGLRASLGADVRLTP